MLLLGSRVDSQTNGTLGNRFFSNWSVSISGGPNIFFGDLKEYNFLPATSPINEIRYAGTFSLNRQLGHVFMLRGQFLFGQLAGEKLKYKDGSPCNQYFESTLFELNLNTTINFSNLILRYNPKRFFFVYGTIGAGAVNWITKKRDITTNAIIGTDGSWETINPHFVIPAGLGAYFSIKDKLNLGLEWTVRGLAIDRLDATVGGFPYDSYSLLAFNITYNFNKRSGNKLSTASPQKQIGPPPPQPLLAAEIAAEKQKEQAAKEQASYLKLPPPPVSKDTLQPKQLILVPDTTPSQEDVMEYTNIMTVPIKGISYRVQVFAFKENTYSGNQIKEKFKLSQTVSKEFSGGWYRYTIGSFTNLIEAKKLMTELHTSREIADAFIAKYINGKRATPAPPHTVKHSKYSKNSKGKIYYRKPAHKK
ncbi:MAG: SPOR domain-containing protein [Bacteroidetes bacterium]|nr:SPOR domain-containing protein [Bacteroidota bacterium]